jgi:glycosyltransferase involved in cell wall biosynthesis
MASNDGSDSAIPTLAVIAISRNEERDLPGFLSTVLPWADEVVLVDDNSTDNTLQVAKEAGQKLRLIDHPMAAGGFAEQRNIGISHARSQWLLHMDVDERVPPALAREIRESISRTDVNAFRYRRLNFFMHRPMRGGFWRGWNNPQLARAGTHKFVNTLHEQCVVDGAPEKVGQLTEEMWHLCDESYLERLSKSNRYCQIDAQKLDAEGRRVRWSDLLLLPAVEFMRTYSFKRGFRDGVPGLISALHAASAVFRTRAIAWEMQNCVSRADLEGAIAHLWHDAEVSCATRTVEAGGSKPT